MNSSDDNDEPPPTTNAAKIGLGIFFLCLSLGIGGLIFGTEFFGPLSNDDFHIPAGVALGLVVIGSVLIYWGVTNRPTPGWLILALYLVPFVFLVFISVWVITTGLKTLVSGAPDAGEKPGDAVRDIILGLSGFGAAWELFRTFRKKMKKQRPAK